MLALPAYQPPGQRFYQPERSSKHRMSADAEYRDVKNSFSIVVARHRGESRRKLASARFVQFVQ
jgi:hypothetical protein